MTCRVVHFGTGYSGVHTLRGIIDHPELELVGLVVHSDDKVGRDAGEIGGLGRIGVVATQDLDAALAVDADAFCYMATTHGRFKAAIAEVCRILESGTNVVTTSFGLLIHPGSARPDVLARLDDAARRGGASLLSTGIEPGFFSDYLPVILSGWSHRLDSLRVYELAVYESGHQSDEAAFTICSFGQPVDTAPPIVDPAGMLPWAGVVRSMADQLGVELDGSPPLECEFSFREGDDHLAGGFNINAMRAVNAIPALCAADAGVVSTFDLPPVTGRGRVAHSSST